MKQKALSGIEHLDYRRKTGWHKFLHSMNEMAAWDEKTAFINPYSCRGGGGCSPTGIEKMLSMYLLQIWFYL